MRFGLCVAATLALLLTGDGWAMGGGGGMVVPGGGAGSSLTVHGGGRQRADKKEARSAKPALPAAAEAPRLDSTRFDKFANQLKLTSEQEKRIGELRTSIEAKAERLAKAQQDARSKYERAVSQSDYMAAARDVISTARACTAYNATLKFESAVLRLLSAEQVQSYRELSKRASS